MIAAGFLIAIAPANAQHVVDPKASLVDVALRQQQLASTTDPLLIAAKKALPSCAHLPFVPTPVGRMVIPKHYLSGSSGPINPLEAPATRIYESFEQRITAGAAQFVANGSRSESALTADQLDAWAKAGALLNYSREESSQAWYQVEWTLCSAAISDSVIVNDPGLDPNKDERIKAWLSAVCRRDLSFEKAGDVGNNHLYWRALAAIAVGVTTSDDSLFQHAVLVYRQAIDEVDERGALPKEMARHENAIHYQGFALQPLVTIAQFAKRQGVDLYSYTNARGRSLKDAIVFFGKAVESPKLVLPYTQDPQKMSFGTGDFAPIAFYVAQYGSEGLPQSIVAYLSHPVSTARIGYTTLLAAP